MLLNLHSRVIEADFHSFVQPTEHAKLSEFCQNYTGILQADLDNSPTLPEVLRMFQKWVESLRLEKDIVMIDTKNKRQNCAFISWCDFDFIYLSTECERKNISLPAYFNKWIDLRDYYSVSIHNC